jgi:hypothetical protein
VIVGILDVAMSTARSQLAGRRESLSAYGRTEWTQANVEAWLASQAYEATLRAIETGRNRAFASLAGKETVAELAENVLRRLSREVGGSAYSRAMPYGSWAEDVRALGFLRPPWSLAHEMLYEMTWRQCRGLTGRKRAGLGVAPGRRPVTAVPRLLSLPLPLGETRVEATAHLPKAGNLALLNPELHLGLRHALPAHHASQRRHECRNAVDVSAMLERATLARLA